MKKPLTFLILTGAWYLAHGCFLNAAAFACAVCFGNSESDQTKGVMAGVILLLGVITFVLGGIIVYIITCVQRAKKLYPAPLSHESI